MTASENRSAHRRRGLGLRTVLLAVAAALVVLPAPAANAAPEHDPVIFVHGYSGDSWNWDDMIADFKADGYADDELYAWDYDHTQSNKVIAEQFGAYAAEVLAETGASQVDVVGHSMGGLNTRWYVKHLGGTGAVDDYVSLGSPQHGTNVAYLCFDTPCYEMRPGSSFLAELNDGDETPGKVRYGSWWSPCDEAIDPKESPVLDGASNTETECLSHTALLTDDTVSAEVRKFVR